MPNPTIQNPLIEKAARAAIEEVRRQTEGDWPAEVGLADPHMLLVDDVIDFGALAQAVLASLLPPSEEMVREIAADIAARFYSEIVSRDLWPERHYEEVLQIAFEAIRNSITTSERAGT